jgi:hypothetical protein
MDAEPEKAPPAREEPSLGTLITIATGLLALVGAIAYAIMRYSYQQFYNVFGLTPDDVGPTSAAALTQSGVGVATFVLLFAVLPVALALGIALACDRLLAQRRTALRFAAAVLASVAVYQAFVSLTSGHLEVKQMLAVALGTLLVLAKRHDGTSTRMQRVPRLRWIVVALLTVVGALVLGGSLPGDARSTAFCAADHPNEPVRFVHTHRNLPFLRHIGVMRVRADPARLAWLDVSNHPPLPPQPLVYLGASSGRDFVFSVGRCHTVQLPEGSVVVTTIPNPKHCHWWNYRSVGPAPACARTTVS